MRGHLMGTFRMCAMIGVAALCLVPASASGRRRRDRDGEKDRDKEAVEVSVDTARSQAAEKKILPPTYIDTLNRDKELCLAKSDFKAIVQPQQDTSQGRGEASSQAAVEGFRIQCAATSSVETARALKREVESKFKYPAYIVFNEPYYKVHVGDFPTRRAAEAALVRVKKGGHEEAWIVRSPIVPRPPQKR
jgi:septal ring-binding cell division protein DamX